MSRLSGDIPVLAPTARDDDEGLFSRDLNGQLVRLDAPTEGDYGKLVTLQIDGQSVTVPLAEPLRDAQGNLVLDPSGQTTPRYTTIHDAASKLYVQQPGDEARIPIPTLCHQSHMRPVAVCRLCVVQVYGQKRGRRAPERKLLPACQHQVKEGMEVFTMNAPGDDGVRVRRAVGVIAELLSGDHLKPAPAPAPAAELEPFNELGQLAKRCDVKSSRYTADGFVSAAAATGGASRAASSVDQSSPVFLVDHSACILCDRCTRSCDEVKNNNVIGRSGKGAGASIAFDLSQPMGESSCVQCGECMVSCPTSAITFKPVARVRVKSGHGQAAEVMTARQLIDDPLFASVPPKFLLWQEGLVLRRTIAAGQLLCRQGEPGNTAFVLKRGRLEIAAFAAAPPAAPSGLMRLFAPRAPAPDPVARFTQTPADLIVGEMACLSGSPRTADIRAVEDSEVWEVRRNVLDRLMRSPTLRKRFETIYRERALEVALRGSSLFRGLPDAEYRTAVDFVRPRLKFVRVNPGQLLFSQGDRADSLYLVRLGHVRVSIAQFGRETSVYFRGPGTVVGEISMLALNAADQATSADELDNRLAQLLAKGDDHVPAGLRTASCSALDHLELARVGRADLLQLIRLVPAVRRRIISISMSRLTRDGDLPDPAVREYIAQGLYQGQSLLVLDLDRCTRCDECTRACADQHGTASHGQSITRLLRDGLRFGNQLVATSCRSCKDAYCMIGCPVDAIHRGKHQQIVIEDHCIGCGLCATNCPYGNIFMLPDLAGEGIARPKAATCDLCDAAGEHEHPTPRCVHACPHDAAHRVTGEQLLAQATGRPVGEK